jgi:hypothetical protein
MKTLLLFLILSATTLHAQYEGLWEGYDGEWAHISKQLIALAEATPADKFIWRPAPGVRSASEVYMAYAISCPICSLSCTMMRRYMPSTVTSLFMTLTLR